MRTDLEKLCIDLTGTLRNAVSVLDQNRIGIVLVVDAQQHLIGTITDGDVRRAILANLDMDGPLTAVLERKAGTPVARPITAQPGEEPSSYLELLQNHKIQNLPILNKDGRVVGLVTRDEFFSNSILPLQAVVMAGGLGTRLRPLTEDIPKPMLPVGDRPLMEIIIEQLRDAGIQRVNIATHHKSERITSHFGDGRQFGIEVRYVAEDRPLGTAGALGLMEPPQNTLLVINGDILTEINFRSMLDYHREHAADVTVGVRKYDFKLPYGMVQCEGAVVRGLTEKPLLECFVNAGIYLLEPTVHQFIPNGTNFDMTDLIETLLEHDRHVVAFPILEYWLDVGQHDDYARAQADIKEIASRRASGK